MQQHMQPQNKSYKKIIITIILLLIVGGGLFLFSQYRKNLVRPSNPNTPSNTNNISNSNSSSTNSSANVNSNVNSNVPLPSSAKLEVAFTAQAPTANWDELHNEACEEASVIMANAYFEKISSLPPATVEKQITDLTKWQQDNYGYYLSITTAETARMAEEVYGLNADIVPFDKNTIKQAIVDGKLVIYPANGQLLDNPNFKAPGPIYHMLVITGYDKDTFITNDPGTRNGFNYKYSYETLEAANGTWDHDTHEINLSDKRIIIVSK